MGGCSILETNWIRFLDEFTSSSNWNWLLSFNEYLFLVISITFNLSLNHGINDMCNNCEYIVNKQVQKDFC